MLQEGPTITTKGARSTAVTLYHEPDAENPVPNLHGGAQQPQGARISPQGAEAAILWGQSVAKYRPQLDFFSL